MWALLVVTGYIGLWKYGNTAAPVDYRCSRKMGGWVIWVGGKNEITVYWYIRAECRCVGVDYEYIDV